MTAANGRAPVDVLAAMEATPETRAAIPAVSELFRVATHFATWSDASPMREELRAALIACGAGPA